MTRYLQILSEHIVNEQLRAAPGYVFLFPSTLLFTETDTHYVFELLGSRRLNGPLLVKENDRVSSLNRIVGSFDPGASTIYMVGPGTPEQTNTHQRFTNLTLTSLLDTEELEKRFPGFTTLASRAQVRSFLSTDSFMPIDARGFRTLGISRCYLVSHLDRVARPRYINFLFAETKEVEESEFAQDIGSYMNIPSRDLMGISAVRAGNTEPLLLAAEFASLYLQDVQETTLTQFLNNHEQMIKRAFNADAVFFELPLPWVEGNPDPDETNIRPDVILRGRDGSWKVLDFKLPLLERKRITTGRRARRKFLYTVNDGISQLFNYADFFNFAANREAAAAILGEQVSNPQLALIVGNTENVNMTEVNEAKRSYKAIDIIDYDTLIRLFLANE